MTTSPTRVFLVGCPRSGTTLLQTMLAAHSRIASFPESHFFRRLLPASRVLRTAGFASPAALAQLRTFLAELGRDDLDGLLPRRALRTSRLVKAFVRQLDQVAAEQGAKVWVEKTPGHLHHLRRIEQYVPDCRFVHLVRNGEDVVASLYEVSQKHPEVWGKRTMEECASRWLEDVAITQAHVGRPNHTLVRFERLVESPEKELRVLCSFLGVEFERTMVDGRAAASRAVVLPSEPWKASVAAAIERRTRRSLGDLAAEPLRTRVADMISAVDLDQLTTRA